MGDARGELFKAEDFVKRRVRHDFRYQRHVHGVAGAFGDHLAQQRAPDQREVALMAASTADAR